MNVSALARTVEKLAVDNSPTLLTAIGVVGTVTTAVLTGKASVRAHFRLQDEYDKLEPPLSFGDEVKVVWKEFVPPVLVGTATVAAIIVANHVGTRRAAAVAAAFSLSEKGWAEYKDKVVEKFGEGKERQLRDELAQDRVTRKPATTEVIVVDNGDVLFYDSFTGRYFNSTMEKVRAAENDTNFKMLQHNYASLSDFYEYVGLPATEFSEEVGWNHDRRLEVKFSGTITEDKRPCIAVSFDVSPVRNYHRIH